MEIENLGDLRNIVLGHQAEWTRWYYRGSSEVYPSQIPKAGRPPFSDPENSDIRYFQSWKRHAVAFREPAQLKDWDWLSIAQHHGLATRLLDWSYNPMVAAFFAVSKDLELDGEICAHYSAQEILGPEELTNPFTVSNVRRVRPSAVAQRILRQGGIFTCHNPPTLTLESGMPGGDQLVKIKIPAKSKGGIAVELSHYGFNHMSLFPDLDGLSEHINWVVSILERP